MWFCGILNCFTFLLSLKLLQISFALSWYLLSSGQLHMQIILSILVGFLVWFLQNLNRELNNHSIDSDISQFKISYNLDNFTNQCGSSLLVHSKGPHVSCFVLKMRAMDESFPRLEGIQNNQTIRETIPFFCFFRRLRGPNQLWFSHFLHGLFY